MILAIFCFENEGVRLLALNNMAEIKTLRSDWVRHNRNGLNRRYIGRKLKEDKK